MKNKIAKIFSIKEDDKPEHEEDDKSEHKEEKEPEH